MTSDSKTPSAPLDLDDIALDAAVGGGGEDVAEETVIFQFGAVSFSKPRSGSDPDRPILVGGVPNPKK